MYKLTGFFLLLMISMTSYAQDKEIQYRSDIVNAFDHARIENKNVFLYFYVDDCEACDYLDDEMYNRSIANLYNESYLNYKLNASTSGKNLAEYYEVYTFPTLLYIDNYGDPLYRAKGYKDGEDIFQIGKLARRSNRDIKKTMENKYKDDPSDMDHLLEYVEYQALQGKYKKSEKLLKEYLEQRSKTDDATWMNAVLDYASNYDSYANEILILEKDKFIANYGQKIVDETIMYSIFTNLQENEYSSRAAKFRNRFNESVKEAGYDISSPEVTVFLATLFYDQNFTNYYNTSEIAKLKHDYGTRIVKIKEKSIPHDLMIAVGVHLITKSRDPVILKNLYGRLEKNIQEKPHYSLLDLQSVVLYLLDDKDASVTKITEARELAMKQNNPNFKPSINQFRRLGIID